MSTSTLRTPAPTATEARPRRGWAAAGVGAGVAGLVGIGGSMGIDAVYRDDIAGDAAGIQARLGDLVPQILVFHTATMVCALLLLVFAAGLHRELRRWAGPESLLPAVAASGLMLVSVAGLVGTGLTTEFVFAPEGKAVPEVSAMFGHWVGTLPFLWAGAGVTALAVAVACLRHHPGLRWLGWMSLVAGAVTVGFGVSPLQYMAGMVGPLWLTLAAVGLLASRGDSTR